MDIRLTHETRGICLSALSGSAVTSGSYESGVLWLTNTQIVILDSIHLWCFASIVTNNVKCQRTALILACDAVPGQGGWWDSVLGGCIRGLTPLPRQRGGSLRCCWARGWLQLTGLCASLCVCCRGESALVHGWWGAAVDGEGGLWCSSCLMLIVPKAVKDSKPFNLSGPLSHPIFMCRQGKQLGPRPPSAVMRFGIRGNFVLRPWSMGGIGATRVTVVVGQSVRINPTHLMHVTLPRLA